MELKDGKQDPSTAGAGAQGVPERPGERVPRQAILGRTGDPELEALVGAVTITRAEALVAWGRKNSLWPIPFGTACCAIEFMGTVSSVFDISRFGAEVVRFSPRQADLMIVSGTITYKQAPILKRIYDQMCEPRYVLSMGVCASSGGFYDNYCTLQGIDKVIPVDYYIGGCPPRPEAVLQAVVELQNRLSRTGA